MEDNNQTVALTPNKDYYLKLPTNSCNRVWVSCKKVDEAPNQCVDYGDEVKVARVLGQRTEATKKLIDYATEEERMLIEEIMNKCKERRDLEKEMNKPTAMSELEKAQRRAERAIARVEELKAQQKENN
jgi:heterodisulfide reductase subunit B